MHFKRIYVEISDYCNLDCKFCTTKKNTRIMSLENFRLTIDKLKGYTQEIVLHVLGEPLIHKNLIEMVSYASQFFKVMITTNGFLLDRYFIKDFIKFHKMNISLHSTYILNEIDTISYLDNVMRFIKYSHNINPKIAFNLRLWANTNDDIKKHNEIIYKYFNDNYQVINDKKNIKVFDRCIITSDREFQWPNMQNPLNDGKGSCKGGKTHIAILANGGVSICCLDSCCDSNLGNIFNQSLDEILNSEKYINTINYFNQNKLYLDICRHCTYYRKG